MSNPEIREKIIETEIMAQDLIHDIYREEIPRNSINIPLIKIQENIKYFILYCVYLLIIKMSSNISEYNKLYSCMKTLAQTLVFNGIINADLPKPDQFIVFLALMDIDDSIVTENYLNFFKRFLNIFKNTLVNITRPDEEKIMLNLLAKLGKADAKRIARKNGYVKDDMDRIFTSYQPTRVVQPVSRSSVAPVEVRQEPLVIQDPAAALFRPLPWAQIRTTETKQEPNLAQSNHLAQSNRLAQTLSSAYFPPDFAPPLAPPPPLPQLINDTQDLFSNVNILPDMTQPVLDPDFWINNPDENTLPDFWYDENNTVLPSFNPEFSFRRKSRRRSTRKSPRRSPRRSTRKSPRVSRRKSPRRSTPKSIRRSR